MNRLTTTWHDLALRHLGLIHLCLIGVSFLLVLDLAGLGIDADWLTLFDRDDSVVREYGRLGAEASNTHTLYVRLTSGDPETVRAISEAIQAVAATSAVSPLVQGDAPSARSWLKVDLRRDLSLSQEQRWEALDEIRAASTRYDSRSAVTGTEAILEEFTDSVRNDFIRTSLVASVLIGLAIFLLLKSKRCVMLGFAYQMVGLLLALVSFRHLYGSLNMLSAALPCVLVGLGVDFVAHSVTAAPGEHQSGDAGIHVYRRVMRPMFWGAVTTALAFLSLTLADLPGLWPVGVMGCLGTLCMFATVMLFLPPALSRYHARGQTTLHSSRRGRGFERLLLPCSETVRRSAALIIFLVCLGLSAFALDARLEDSVENLYDPGMDSLLLQSELTAQVGAYPSVLFASFVSKDPERVISELSRPHAEFLVNPSSARIVTEGDSESVEAALQLMARSNPFDPRNMTALRERLGESTRLAGGSNLVLTGDAVLSQHMNDLLVRGMTVAFLAVFGLLAVVLTVMFRSPSYVVLPLCALALSVSATLGGISILGVNVSVYNLTLFPLFVGIGVDDCLYVAHAVQRGNGLESSPHVVRGITLTTITTLLAYGSLLAANNVGFAAMGKTACLGLTLTFLGAAYLLPVMLSKDQRG